MNYKEYFINQASKSQYGGNIKTFRGTSYQSGHGLGGLFNTLRNSFSWLLPILKTHALPALKSGAEVVGRELIKTATNIATDKISGKDLKESFETRATEGINNISKSAQKVLSGGKRKINKIKKFLDKKRKLDIFDYN